MFKFEELNVYKESIKLASKVYELTSRWPKTENHALSDQFRRAVVSISLNIAEGTGRKINDFRHFLDLSRGSCYECVAILQIALNQNYISSQEYHRYYEELEVISKMTSALKKSLL